MDFPDDRHHLVDARTEVHLATGAELTKLADHALENVRQRQVRDPPVVGIAAEALQGRDRGPSEIAMREDRGFRKTGGTRGVDQAGGVLRPDRLPAAGEEPRPAAAEFIAPAPPLAPGGRPRPPFG